MGTYSFDEPAIPGELRPLRDDALMAAASADLGDLPLNGSVDRIVFERLTVNPRQKLNDTPERQDEKVKPVRGRRFRDGSLRSL